MIKQTLDALIAPRMAPAAWETVSPGVYIVSAMLDLQLKQIIFFLIRNLKNVLFKYIF